MTSHYAQARYAQAQQDAWRMCQDPAQWTPTHRHAWHRYFDSCKRAQHPEVAVVRTELRPCHQYHAVNCIEALFADLWCAVLVEGPEAGVKVGCQLWVHPLGGAQKLLLWGSLTVGCLTPLMVDGTMLPNVARHMSRQHKLQFMNLPDGCRVYVFIAYLLSRDLHELVHERPWLTRCHTVMSYVGWWEMPVVPRLRNMAAVMQGVLPAVPTLCAEWCQRGLRVARPAWLPPAWPLCSRLCRAWRRLPSLLEDF